MDNEKEHPYKTGSNEYFMDPTSLISLGIDIDENCVVCGINQTNKLYYVDSGLIHCIECGITHNHITRKESEEIVKHEINCRN